MGIFDWIAGVGIAVLVLGGALYVFISDAEEYTGAKRVAAFVCRIVVYSLFASGLMAFMGVISFYGASQTWTQAQLALWGIKTYADVVSVEHHQTWGGRRLRRYVDAYTTTLRPAPQCGVENAVVELKEASSNSGRIYFYCVPSKGIAGVTNEIDWSLALLNLFYAGIFLFVGRFLFYVLRDGWRPMFDKPKRV
jgi:hypothetical protein